MKNFQSNFATFVFLVASRFLGVVAIEGMDRDICAYSGTVIDTSAEKYGFITSDNYPNGYSGYVGGCMIQFDVPNPNHYYIAFRVLEWNFDQSGWGDHMTVWMGASGSFWPVADIPYYTGSWLNGYRSTGAVRLYWYTDCCWNPYWYGTPRWRITWTLQKYIFGCELYPQPYIFPNTTKYGVIQSPFFPDQYPVNINCQTVIDIDQAVDMIEFSTVTFKVRSGDALYIYTGDAQLNNWLTWKIFNVGANPGVFRIYGADVKITFVSDYVATSYGYKMYWRVISKERYPIYKPQSLVGFWPMTAAHRGNDVVQGCNAAAYPPTGTISPTTGPFGDRGVALYFNNAYLNMTSPLCQLTTQLNSSYSISLFAQTTVNTPIYEYQLRNGNGQYADNLWGNYPSSGQIGGVYRRRSDDTIVSATGIATNIRNYFSHYTIVQDSTVGKGRVYQDNALLQTVTTAVNFQTSLTDGFLFGYRDNRLADGGVPQIGRFSCMTMYSEALSLADQAQVRAMCQKFHQQYQVFPGQSLVGWWPFNSIIGGWAKDTSGNGRHATVTNIAQVTLANGPSGATNTAFNFGGSTGSSVTFPFSMTNLMSFTINFYVKSTSTTPRGWIGFYPPSGAAGVAIGQGATTNDLTMHPYYSVSTTVKAPALGVGFSTWKFVSCSYDLRTRNMTIWIDGGLVVASNLTTAFDIGVGANGFIVGSQPGIANFFQGQMSCLSVFSVSLTARQIAMVKAACDEGYGNPPSMYDVLGFWPLTGATGTNDISGNEFHGLNKSANVVLSPGPFGVANTAYTLGYDANSYINFPAAGLNLGTGSWTISMYIKLLKPDTKPIFEYLLSPDNPGAAVGMHWWAQSNALYVYLTCGSPVWWGGFLWNQWQFITQSYNADTGIYSMWRDGSVMSQMSATCDPSSIYGFNLGKRSADGQFTNMQVACLSIYQVALDAEGIGRVLSTCQSYLMEQRLRDQSIMPEVNCNFDAGFCGWSQDVADDGVDWQLEHDQTPTGIPNAYYTGPRVGKSTERIDALDQYALINTADLGFNLRARLISPVIATGWHCFSFWYYMAGGNVNSMTVTTAGGTKQIFGKTGSQGKQWTFAASSFYLSAPDFIAIDGKTGTTTIYSDIAIDDIRVTDGPCGGSTPCPPGWIDYGRKCYMPFFDLTSYTWQSAMGNCEDWLKGRLALPENPEELAFLQSLIGGNTISIDAQRPLGTWVNSFGYPLTYLPWASAPAGGLNFATLTSSGFVASTDVTNKFVCEVTKMEAQHLGFNCSFDNKHLCGWWNLVSDGTDPGHGGSSNDVDIWGGITQPWQNEDDPSGAEWDWNQGSSRGYYVLLVDNAIPTCSGLYADLFSPVMKATGIPQCIRFRTFRAANVGKIDVILWENGALSPANPVTGQVGLNWRTFELEVFPKVNWLLIIRLYYSCNGGGFGNQVVDDIQLFDSTCAIPLFQNYSLSATDSERPQPTFTDSVDTLGDTNMYSCNDQWNAWRDTIGDHTNWGCGKGYHQAGYRRTGPQSDYTGEGNYLQLDYNWQSLITWARWSGPPIASGQKCFIFHYFMYGYDVGELRLLDGKGRYLFARQRSQSPSWKEHRILFSDSQPTTVIFEGSSGHWDGNFHLQRYQSLQLDDIYTRNGTDLCLGYMDCDFDRSSYVTDCGWQQNDTDDGDWVRNSGETPAGNGMTGPSADRTSGLGHYLYFDATNLRPGARARIHMPPVAAGSSCLTFYYHMWGNDTGSLRVFYFPQKSLQFSGGNFPPYSEATLWSKSGQQANFWIRAMVPVSLDYPQTLTFEAMRGGGDRSDIAIDDVVLLKGQCPNDNSLTCSFERGSTCLWYNDPSAQLKFIVNRGKTQGQPMTGPEGDSTGSYAGGFYAYMPSNAGSTGDAARLLSPWLPKSTVCFQMSYNMRGRQLGQINIYRNTDRLLRIRGGTTGYEWRRIVMTVKSNITFTLKIEATRGAYSLSDIGIDDILVTDGPCPFKKQANTPSPVKDDFVPVTGYNMVGHLIAQRPVRSLAECIVQCNGMPGCLSVNYNNLESTCQLNDASFETDPYNYLPAPSTTNYVSLLSTFAQRDMTAQNLCTLDSPVCKLSAACYQTLASLMLVCRCVEPARSCFMPKDCTNLMQYGVRTSGAYLIQPTVNASAVMAWCEIDAVNAKAYTVLVKRNNGGTRFHNRKLEEYKTFFGTPTGEYWIGLETMYQLTSQANYGYKIEGSLYNTTYSPIDGITSATQAFQVGPSSDQYRLKLQQVGAMTTTMHNSVFSTIDSDATGVNQCPATYGLAGWWYNACLDGSLTGPYRPNEALSSSRVGMYASDFGSATGLTAMKLKITQI